MDFIMDIMDNTNFSFLIAKEKNVQKVIKICVSIITVVYAIFVARQNNLKISVPVKLVTILLNLGILIMEINSVNLTEEE